jgi:hypothetical protein
MKKIMPSIKKSQNKATTSKTKDVKKPVPKKSAKKVTKSTSQRKPKFMQANPECSFWINNGPVLSNLLDLYEALSEMNDEMWKYHTIRAGNDFAVWIEDVLCEPILARKIKKLKSRDGMRKAIRAHLK